MTQEKREMDSERRAFWQWFIPIALLFCGVIAIIIYIITS